MTRKLDILSLISLVLIGALAMKYDALIAALAVVPGLHLAIRLYSCRVCKDKPPVQSLYNRVVSQHGHTWTCRFLDDDQEVAGVATLNVTEVPSKMVANVFMYGIAVADRPVGNIDEAEAWIRQERTRLQAIVEDERNCLEELKDCDVMEAYRKENDGNSS